MVAEVWSATHVVLGNTEWIMLCSTFLVTLQNDIIQVGLRSVLTLKHNQTGFGLNLDLVFVNKNAIRLYWIQVSPANRDGLREELDWIDEV